MHAPKRVEKASDHLFSVSCIPRPLTSRVPMATKRGIDSHPRATGKSHAENPFPPCQHVERSTLNFQVQNLACLDKSKPVPERS
ncbi:hypothetical protein AVEN_139707-1 [Araneus ventricosus]|uniref:Uncharacterized protein n=1 Tax=Araneus ventricosus TaxID=182803 RepID=A0A4Y2LGJ5_ARAVE|nr:hypothetical protein AVEN_139707-1 [Araneus ventricosus]